MKQQDPPPDRVSQNSIYVVHKKTFWHNPNFGENEIKITRTLHEELGTFIYYDH
jgi:hypothetical protein